MTDKIQPEQVVGNVLILVHFFDVKPLDRRLWARTACLLAGKRVSRDLVLGSGGEQVANFLVCTMLIIVYNLDHLVIMLRY